MLVTKDMLMDKTVLCTARYRHGYGMYAYFHECMSCNVCAKNKVINSITISFIYVRYLLKCLLRH